MVFVETKGQLLFNQSISGYLPNSNSTWTVFSKRREDSFHFRICSSHRNPSNINFWTVRKGHNNIQQLDTVRKARHLIRRFSMLINLPNSNHVRKISNCFFSDNIKNFSRKSTIDIISVLLYSCLPFPFYPNCPTKIFINFQFKFAFP